ncbi:hypothetical protein ACLOJK_026020 [Asimina triloba]
MVSKASALKLRLSHISFLSLTLLLLLLNYQSQLETTHRRLVASPSKNVTENHRRFDLFREAFEGKKLINIGLVNMEEEEQKEGVDFIKHLRLLGNTTTATVHFDRVPKDLHWVDFFPEWIDEDRKFHKPKCPTIPMPRFDDYGFDVVISRLPPCGSSRDVLRLQVHLVVANLVLRSGSAMVVFLGPCEPMWEMFRCEDVVRREEDLWVFRPDLRRLKQKLVMPVGSCELAMPFIKQESLLLDTANAEQVKRQYNVSKLEDTLEHPRLAYATVLHSSEDYVCGAIALAQSLILTNTTHDLILLADNSVTKKSLVALAAAGWKIKLIDRIRSPQAKKNAYNEWNYSKLRIWQLTEYDKIMFIDADLIVLKNLDRILAVPQLSAVGNDGVLFNSGVMVIEPSECVFKMLMNKRYKVASYNGGDQGYLNEVFSWWHRLPRRLNQMTVFKWPGQAKRRELRGAYAIHYLGFKPWMCFRDYDCNWDKMDHQIFASDSAHRRWWKVYDSMPRRLQPACALSQRTQRWLKRLRVRARNASLADGHWKIKIKDPRQVSLTKLSNVKKSYNVGF